MPLKFRNREALDAYYKRTNLCVRCDGPSLDAHVVCPACLEAWRRRCHQRGPAPSLITWVNESLPESLCICAECNGTAADDDYLCDSCRKDYQ